MNDSMDPAPEALREEMAITRRRMDETLQALEECLRPTHLLDRFLGRLRRQENGAAPFARPAADALRKAWETARDNPVPAALAATGLGWLAYRAITADSSDDQPGPDQPANENPVEVVTPGPNDALRAELERLREQFADFLDRHGYDPASAGGWGGVRAGLSRSARATATFVDEHAFEVAVCSLAAGLAAGLMLPTPAIVHRKAGAAAEGARARLSELQERLAATTARVAKAAVSAAKSEAAAGSGPDIS